MSESQTNMPTVGSASATGSTAEDIFKGAFRQPAWLVRKQSPDFFVDYLVEVVESGEPTGRQFAAQVKGTQLRKGTEAPLKYSAKAKQVRYWLQKCLHPVFVFLIDVDKGTGHWLFVQKYVQDEITKSALQKQTKVTLRFSPDDSLQDMERFKAALKNAELHVRDLHPSSVQAALAKTRQELEKKDPRLTYTISATEGAQTVHITPKEPIVLKLQVLSPHAAETNESLKHAIEHGAELKLGLDKIKLTGSPVFEDFNGAHGHFLIQCGQSVPGQVIFRPTSDSRQPSMCVEGDYRVGTKTAIFRSRPGIAPLEVKCTFASGSDPEHMSVSLELVHLIRCWHGQPVLQLSHFDAIFALMDGIAKDGGLRTEFYMSGTSFAAGTHSGLGYDHSSEILKLLLWLDRCRAVAFKYGVNPKLPPLDKITHDQWEAVDDVTALMHGNKRVCECPGLSVDCVVSNFNETVIQGAAFGCFRVGNPDAPFDILGQTIRVGGIYQTFTNVTVEKVGSDDPGWATLKLTGSNSTMRIIERSKPHEAVQNH